MTVSLFDNFDRDLGYSTNDIHYDDDDSDYQRAVELHEKLSRVSYTLTDDELESLFWTIVCDVLEKPGVDKCAIIRTQLTQDAIFNSISTHYGWNEVDTRRIGLVREYCKDLLDYIRQNPVKNST